MQAKEIINNALKANKDEGSQYLLRILKDNANYEISNFVVIDAQPQVEGEPLNHYDVIFRNGIVRVHISVDANTFKLISTNVSNIYVEEQYLVKNGGTLDVSKLFDYLD